MKSGSLKSLLVAVFSIIMVLFFNVSQAQPEDAKETQKLDPAKLIMEHVSDGHEFHFATVAGHHVTIPLPVILYTQSAGFSVFMSSVFGHGTGIYNGFMLLEDEFMDAHKLHDVKDGGGNEVFQVGKIYAVGADGVPIPPSDVKVYDFSMTRNVVQLLLSLFILCWLMIKVAKQYKKGQGVNVAPTGFQNAIEPVITFVRDEVALPNLGDKSGKYLPYLLTVFFFILINNLVGLIPGGANVTGNIAFTALLGIISFIVILFSSNKHYWGHIVNPPVPFGIKLIMIPIEIMGIFTKPFALIIRLFANMISGHIIILSFICLIFIFGTMNTALGWGTSPLFVAFSVFIYLLEILVAFIQAYIFANLTAVFIGQAFEGGHDDGNGHHVPEDTIIV